MIKLVILSLSLSSSFALGQRNIFSDEREEDGEEVSYMNGHGTVEFAGFVEALCERSEFRCEPANQKQSYSGDAYVTYYIREDESGTKVTLRAKNFEAAQQEISRFDLSYSGFSNVQFTRSNATSKDLQGDIEDAEDLQNACRVAKETCTLAATLMAAKRDRLGLLAFLVCSSAGTSCETRLDRYINKLKQEKEQKEKEEKEKEEKEKKNTPPSSPTGTSPGADGGGNRAKEGHSDIPADKPGRRGTVTIIDHPDKMSGPGCSHIRCFPN